MLNTRRADPTRDEVTCPYNAAHVIVASRLGNHLIKCEKNYPNMDKAKCRFNCDHIVPKHCVGHHEALCPNRQTLERFTHKVGESMCPVKDVVPIHVAVPSCEEDWDSVPVSSPLEVIQETIVEKPVLRLLAVNGLTKSERKQFKLQEQARLRKLEEEKAFKDARKAQNDVKKSHKKEKPKVSTDTEVRLPKTSKIAAESSLSAQKENDIGQLTNQLHLQTLDDGESGFDQETYYENNYMGGYGMPSNAADKSLKSSYGYQEEECLGAYEGTGYDVEYYGGYSGGYNDGRYDNLSEDAEEEEGPQPRWMKVSKKGGKKGVAGCSDRGQTESKGAQQRLLQLKEAQRIQNIKNTEALKVKVTSNNNNEPSPFSPSCVSLPSPALENNFNSELDENGFFRIPITRGRGRKL